MCREKELIIFISELITLQKARNMIPLKKP